MASSPTDQATHLPSLRTVVLTVIAMLAFAGNNLLCRLALAHDAIDPASFALVRLASGGVTLWLLMRPSGGKIDGSWAGAVALLTYAFAFSFAYVTLQAGAGALFLFGAVQITMIATSLAKGERLAGLQWMGFAAAVAGFVMLVAPGVSAPPVGGAILMIGAGLAWGAYSLIGRGATNAMADTAGNFLRSIPVAVVLWALAAGFGQTWSFAGAAYAMLSGAVTSGLGYTIWYAALPGLTRAQSSSVQLSAPVITALIGTVLLSESVTLRLALSSIAILGGIALVIGFGRARS
ncbi:MAG: DMT family transporter [Hyphomicrobiales bacterium]|nr:MAG: DMT family transporter [Hyphomicrobiales bacterium]